MCIINVVISFYIQGVTDHIKPLNSTYFRKFVLHEKSSNFEFKNKYN